MPELPEVETVKRTLSTQVLNKPIIAVTVFYEPMIKNVTPQQFQDKLIGNQITEILRRGKYLIFKLTQGYLVSHLRMEGKYFFEDESEVPGKHVHVAFRFEDKTQLFYEDTRKFGTFHYFETFLELEQSKSFQALGVEPFSDAFTPSYVKKHLEKKKKPIKSLLLDQTVVVGLGNIYVDEVLFRSKINPLTKAYQLTELEAKEIVTHTNQVLAKAIEHRGTTIRTFASSHGSGTYQHELKVHQRAGEPCPVCQTNIVKIKVGGRGTYYCEMCQPILEEE